MPGEKLQNYQIDARYTMWLKNQLCTPQDQQIREAILLENTLLQPMWLDTTFAKEVKAEH